ncbi:hypothetical protein MHU86_19784 [Fragilaria crotonensis]|nr:hypothetical protein MHU86_19784 [Fragilaria crotonensis]
MRQRNRRFMKILLKDIRHLRCRQPLSQEPLAQEPLAQEPLSQEPTAEQQPPAKSNSRTHVFPIPDVILEIPDFAKRPFIGSDASPLYCAAVDTGNAATVIRTAVSSPNPQQWACRAHNPTISSESLTYLDVQHPVPIKVEDLPSSPADADVDDFVDNHCYSCSNNDSTRETVNFYPDADPDPLPEVANNPDPKPMDIVEDDLDNNGDANQDIGEPNEVPSTALQQPASQGGFL